MTANTGIVIPLRFSRAAQRPRSQLHMAQIAWRGNTVLAATTCTHVPKASRADHHQQSARLMQTYMKICLIVRWQDAPEVTRRLTPPHPRVAHCWSVRVLAKVREEVAGRAVTGSGIERHARVAAGRIPRQRWARARAGQHNHVHAFQQRGVRAGAGACAPRPPRCDVHQRVHLAQRGRAGGRHATRKPLQLRRKSWCVTPNSCVSL